MKSEASGLLSRSAHLWHSWFPRPPSLVSSPEPRECAPGYFLEGSTGCQGLMVNGLTVMMKPKPIISAEQGNTEISTCSRLWRETSTLEKKQLAHNSTVYHARPRAWPEMEAAPLTLRGGVVSRKGEASFGKSRRDLFAEAPNLPASNRENLFSAKCPSALCQQEDTLPLRKVVGLAFHN